MWRAVDYCLFCFVIQKCWLWQGWVLTKIPPLTNIYCSMLNFLHHFSAPQNPWEEMFENSKYCKQQLVLHLVAWKHANRLKTHLLPCPHQSISLKLKAINQLHSAWLGIKTVRAKSSWSRFAVKKNHFYSINSGYALASFCFIPSLQTFTPLPQLSALGFSSRVMLKQVDGWLYPNFKVGLGWGRW